MYLLYTDADWLESSFMKDLGKQVEHDLATWPGSKNNQKPPTLNYEKHW